MKKSEIKNFSLHKTAVFVIAFVIIIIFSHTANAAVNTPITGTKGLVLSSSPEADLVGYQILNAGGNAMDAAVAVGFAMAVTYPKAGNIGGGGFALIHTADGKNTALDFREKAPLAATKDMYLDKEGNIIPNASVIGHRAAGVPGSVKGLCEIHSKYGTLPLEQLIKPAIKLAENGFTISRYEAEAMNKYKSRFESCDASKKYFLKNDGTSYKEGDIFVQSDLGKTLRLIAKNGSKVFYEGKIADLITEDMKKNGGYITKKDLAEYNVVWREPVKGSYRGHEIVSMSPPSAGGIQLIEILNIIENADIAKMGAGSADAISLMAEAEKYSFADRFKYLGDSDFVKVSSDKLTDKEYAKRIYKKIKAAGEKATPSKLIYTDSGTEHIESPQTTHFSIIDKYGNAVAITYTINSCYGSGAAVEGAGFLLNNEMDDFSTKEGKPNQSGMIGGSANKIEPQKRPLSSMTPTIILKDGKLCMIAGSPGSSRIITSVLQVIVNVIDYGMNISEAVAYPRIHMQLFPDEIRYEPHGINPDTKKILEKRGYKLVEKSYMGDVNAIYIPPTNTPEGTHDPRNNQQSNFFL